MASAAISVLVALSLVGCSAFREFVPPGTFNTVNQARDELDMETAGEIQVEGEFGGAIVSDQGPTYLAVIEGESAPSVIESRLLELGYSKTSSELGTTLWKRVSADDSVVEITLDAVDAGDEFGIGDREIVTVEATGASIEIRG